MTKLQGLFQSTQNNSSDREIPRVEPVELIQHPAVREPILMTKEDLEKYGATAKAAQKLAQKELQQLQTLHREENMNFFEKIWLRLQEKQTSITGGLAFLVPMIATAIGLTAPQIALVNVGFSVATAWLAKKDVLSASGLTVSFVAQALPIFGVATPEWVAAILNAVAGVLSKDQRNGVPVQPAALLVAVGILLFSQPLFAQTAFPIPQSFRQNSIKITVVFDAKYCDSVNAGGTFDFRKKLIRLNDGDAENRIALEQTFFHELVHCSLEHTSYWKLSENERFVERFARSLHEAFTTMRWEQVK